MTLIIVAKTIAQYRTRSFLNEYRSHNTLQETEKKKVTSFRQKVLQNYMFIKNK